MPINTGPQRPGGSTPLPGSFYNNPYSVTPVGSSVPSSPMSTQPVYPGAATGGDQPWYTKIGNFLLDHWEDLAKLGITAYTTKEAIQNANKSSDLTDKALGMAQSDYDSRAPFRTAAAGKLAATRPDLASVFADPGNPYKAMNRSIPAVGTGAPGAPFVETPSVGGYTGPPQSGTVGGEPPQALPVYRPPASGAIPRVGRKMARGAL